MVRGDLPDPRHPAVRRRPRPFETVLGYVHPDDRERMERMLADAVERPEAVPEGGIEHDGPPRPGRRLGARDARRGPARARRAGTRALGGCDAGRDRAAPDRARAARPLRRQSGPARVGVLRARRRRSPAPDRDRAGLPDGGPVAVGRERRRARLPRVLDGAGRRSGRLRGGHPRRSTSATGRASRGSPGRPASRWSPPTSPRIPPSRCARRRSRAGSASAIAFPAVGPDGPVAVLSFYSFERRAPSRSSCAR